MSTKDTVIIALLVLNSAAIIGLVATRPGDQTSAVSGVTDQVEALTARIDDVESRTTSRTADRSRSRLANVEARLGELETAAAPRRTGAAAGRGSGSSDDDESTARAAEKTPEETEARAVAASAKLAAVKALTSSVSDVGASLGKRIAGLKLRMLPEEERWEKLRDALGLGSAQESDLRLAIARRDDEFGAATTRDSRTEGDQYVTTTEVDVERVEAADSMFRDTFQRTLSAEQHKTWNDGGWADGMLRGRPKAGTKRKLIEQK